VGVTAEARGAAADNGSMASRGVTTTKPMVGQPADPRLGEVLRRARLHRGLTLRQVEDRTGVLNAHLSQIERGQIRRPDQALLWRLCELYELDFGLVAGWAGYDMPVGDNSALLAAALRLLSDLDPDDLDEALRVIERLSRHRNERTHAPATRARRVA
jgi:transcriptional regulator with XRE-family HTH domain